MHSERGLYGGEGGGGESIYRGRKPSTGRSGGYLQGGGLFTVRGRRGKGVGGGGGDLPIGALIQGKGNMELFTLGKVEYLPDLFFLLSFFVLRLSIYNENLQ